MSIFEILASIFLALSVAFFLKHIWDSHREQKKWHEHIAAYQQKYVMLLERWSQARNEGASDEQLVSLSSTSSSRCTFRCQEKKRISMRKTIVLQG